MPDDQPQTPQERCSCGGTIIFDDERGVARCPNCKSYEAYTTPVLRERATKQPQTTAAAAFLDEVAWQCDAWATESERNGWSTHQVVRNRHWADLCRRKAAELRRGENV